MFSRIFQVIMVAGLATSQLRAETDAFVGHWKLIKATDQMSVTKVGANTFAFDFGGGTETIVADGIEQPGIAGTTLSVTADGPSWKVVRKKGGHMLLAATWTLFNNGHSLKDDFTDYSQPGASANAVYLYERRAAGSGFAGRWVGQIKPLGADTVLQIRPYESNGLSLTIPSRWTIKATFDGKDHPSAGAGSASSARRLNVHAVEIIRKSKGQITQTRRIELSPDFKVLTMTVDAVGTNGPYTYVFERQ